MAKTKLSISLVKSGITDFADMVKVRECDHMDIPDVGTFFYNDSFLKEPAWVSDFFMGQLGDEPKLKTAFVQGLLIVKREYSEGTRYFAIAFGYGRNLLIPGAIEPRFGLKTTLNIINPQRLRSVDKNSLESIPTKGRVQSSRLSDQGVFNLDKERDILRSITAKTSDEKQDDFGGTVYGSDSLHFSREVDITTIKDLLDKCYAQYQLDVYKQSFDWIDHLESIKDLAVINALNTNLMSSINSRDLSTIWMAVPELLNWENQLSFHLGGRGNESDDLDIQEVLYTVFNGRDDITVEELKKKHVKVVDSNGIKVGGWPYYRCLYGEVTHNDSLYILNEGEWFKVDDNYNAQVVGFYEEAAIFQKKLIDSTRGEIEDSYNKKLANSDSTFCLLDKQLVATGISQNKIEICDVITANKELIHIKKGHGSSVLSHLFNQGYVSGTMLLQLQFRRNANKKIKKMLPCGINQSDWLFTETNNYRPSQYTIVFGIITGENTNRPRIPFFSKVVFRQVTTTLTNQGYSVCLANISY